MTMEDHLMNQADEMAGDGGWVDDEPSEGGDEAGAHQLGAVGEFRDWAPARRFEPVPAWPVPKWTDPNLKPGPTGGLAVLQGLVDAMRLLPAVGKDQEHRGDRTGTWNYRSADAVVSAVGPALAEAGVVLLPVLNSDQAIDLGGQDGWRLDMTYRFFGVDGSSLSFRMVSHSVGRTAYTIGAGYSYALKYALSQALCLPFDDDRMDMESGNSNGVVANWWQDGGWESEAAHTEWRTAFLGSLTALAPDQLAAVKRALSEVRDAQLFSPKGERSPLGAPLWVPEKLGEFDGPGRFPGRLSLAAAERAADAFEAATADEATPRGEIPDNPEFDVDGPGDEPSQAAPTGPVAAPAPDTAPSPANAREGATGAAEGKPAARQLTAAQLKASRAALTRSMLKVSGEWAARIEATLTDAGLWPIGDLADSVSLDRAADLILPILVEAGAVKTEAK